MDRAVEYFRKQPETKPTAKTQVEREFLRLSKDESSLIKQVIKRSAPKENPDYSLPEILEIDMDTFIKVYPDWLRWVALERRYPPSVIRKQPKWLLDAFIYLDSLLERMSGEFYDAMRKKNGQ